MRTYVHGKAIKQLTSGDGNRSVAIVARDDGAFQWYEHIKLPADDGGGWMVGQMSGLYESAEAAELAAHVLFDLGR